MPSLLDTLQRFLNRLSRKPEGEEVRQPVTSGTADSKALGKQGRPERDEFDDDEPR